MHGLMMDYPLTVDRILEHANRLYAHKHIITKQPDGSLHRYTYADLYDRVKRLANVLHNLGIQPGDRVGTFAWNNYQHLEFYYAIPASGAVCHTLNIRLFTDQLAYVINHAEDKVIFIDGTLLPLFEKVVDQINGVQHYVLFNTDKNVQTALPNVSFYEDLMAGASNEYTWGIRDEQIAAGLCYTSGTTGDPKGALYSHRSIYLHSLGVNQANALGLTEQDIILTVVPMFHAMCWGLPYAAAFAGAQLLNPGPFLQAPALADMIAEEKVTVAAGVPTIWTGLYHELKARPRDISHVRALVVGGSAMPRSLIEAYEKELGVNVVHAWGMTEMSPIGTVSKLQKTHETLSEAEKWDIKARQGYPVPGVEMRIVDELGRELPWDGETMGEVQVRGPWIIERYFKRESSPEHFTEDGWFRTGDVATMSPDGYMNITDRTKDLIKSGGEWISSVALENALMAHPEVLEATVIAIPDEKWAERPMAVVVPVEADNSLAPDDLQDYLATQFAKFWLPDKIIFAAEIPKTSVGKFDKKALRQALAEGKLI
jgi:acyl-CoA synthetase (AMP-forming)/AMP-acid ligase II